MPARLQFKDRNYLYLLFILYAGALVRGTYDMLFHPASSPLYPWYTANTVLQFVLVLVVGTIPQPMNPVNFESTPQEVVEIKDNQLYRSEMLVSPETTASILSWACFYWMQPLVSYGYRHVITRKDIFSMSTNHLARFAYLDFKSTRERMAAKRLLMRLYVSNKTSIWLQFVFSTLAVLVSYLTPYFQYQFLEYIDKPEGRPIQVAYTYVIGMFSVSLLKLACNNIQLYYGRRWNVRTLSMLDAEIYEKTLRRKDMSGKVNEEGDNKEDSDKVSGTGKITNLMAIDADRLSDLPSYIFMFYNAPVEVTVAIVYLYNLLGVAAFVGLGVMLAGFPFTALIMKRVSKVYEDLTKARDKRNDLLNELLQGIRMIKFFAWENNWTKRVQESRANEIKTLIWNIVYDVILDIIFSGVPVLVTACSFIYYTKVAQNEMSASVVFTSITLFEMLRRPIILIPDSFTTFAEAYISMKRIVNYLAEPEVDDQGVEVEVAVGGNPQASLTRTGFSDATFQWHAPAAEDKEKAKNAKKNDDTDDIPDAPTTAPFVLHTSAFNFPTGHLSLVCGPTGGGKTSLLYALLGEMDATSGHAYLPSKNKVVTDSTFTTVDEVNDLKLDGIAYVAQTAYLQQASIRDNILFGEKFDPVRYKKVLYACALIPDLKTFNDGDRTEIGEKGISLSGGQKQRVSLARAVYSRAKTVLLDDCLSAVDSHTAKHIFFHCIKGDLLRERTVVLVTHHVRLCLPAAHYLVKVDGGRIAGHGSVDALRASGELLTLIGDEMAGSASNSDDDADDEADKKGSDLATEEWDSYVIETDDTEVNKLVADETSAEGSVKLHVYRAYFDACGGIGFWLLLMGCYILARVFYFGETWWLRLWATAYADEKPSVLAFATSDYETINTALYVVHSLRTWAHEVDVNYYIGMYCLLCFLAIFFQTLRAIVLYAGSIRGARLIFHQLFDRILHAPMRFFDTTPVGRILNRFGKDVTVIDLRMARAAAFFLECCMGLIQSTIVITFITPQFAIVAFIVSGVYFLVGTYYLRTSRSLKRLNSVSRSPIYSQFSETISGVTTIRAYGQQMNFMYTLYDKIDSYISPFYLLWMANRWLYCRMEFTGAFVTLSAGVFILLSLDYIDAGLAGLSLFYAYSFLDSVYWFIRMYTDVEMNLNSVERVQEYLELTQEAPAVIEGRRPPAAWPTEGAIQVKELEVRYAPDLDPVLKKISFDIKPHAKIGVIGRTGSGKSTMALAFFRMLETTHGSISIDGINIEHIGLSDLRGNLTVIPQDAVLFSGTLRSNLDPFGEHGDAELFDVLQRVHLIAATPTGANTPSGESSNTPTLNPEAQQQNVFENLDYAISEDGHNLSQGQRQLVCMARALLRRNKIVIMDEATSSVDFETDRKIQNTIATEFAHCTILCIAHRLRTIADYDRVLVLDKGTVIEFDNPYTLMCNPDSAFYQMCRKSGEFDTLLAVAKQKHQLVDVDE
ncbi:P-loop containing nucleoside triphosphate hydrolase protein [Gongronella butleri]|nr:P-loop containing nucleoside triphosphate hydrolase protein [Gongronella butleri]